jgi:hypothetical protein
MGNSKKATGVIISIIILVLLFGSCSPVSRHARLVKKYPFVHHTDTVVLSDTINIITPIVQHDTVMLLDSFIISLKDTITIKKDNLIVKITEVHDSIYIDAKCDTIFIDKIIERKIPVKYYEVKDKFSIKEYISCIGLILVILIALIIIFKIIKLLK